MSQELLDDDQKILENTRSLCQSLDVKNYAPVLVAWENWVPQTSLWRGRSRMIKVPPDECLLTSSQVVLPAVMRGRLEPNEWKAICLRIDSYKETSSKAVGTHSYCCNSIYWDFSTAFPIFTNIIS